MKNIFWFLVLMLMFTTGCVSLPMPESTIEPPKLQASYQTSEEMVFAEFIPEDMELLTRENSDFYEPVSDDFDGDGKVEVMLFYGSSHKNRCEGIIILEEDEEGYSIKWDMASEIKMTYAIVGYHLLDLFGTGEMVLVTELGYYSEQNIIQLFSLGETPEKLHVMECNTLEVIIEEGKTPALAIWIDVTMELDYIEVIRWNADKGHFEQATYDVADYYEKLVPFYKKNAEETPQLDMNIYYLADTLMKAGLYEEGLETIEHFLGEAFYLSSIYKMKGNFVKAKCAYGLGDVALAKEALIESVNQSHYYLDKLLEARELLCLIYAGEKNLEEAQIQFEDMQLLSGKFYGNDYKKMLWQDRVDILETLLKGP